MKNTIIGSALFSSIFLASIIVGDTACTKVQGTQIINSIPPTAACIVDLLMVAGGTEDPATIATACSTAVSDVLSLVQTLLANEPKNLPDAGSAPITADWNRPDLAKLQRVKASAQTLLNMQSKQTQ